MATKPAFFPGLCIAAVLTIGSASAQTRGVMEVNLPESFTVSGIKLPAGDYSIVELSGARANTVLLVRSASGVRTTVLAEPVPKAQQATATASSVTLQKVDGQMQLDIVWIAGSDVGYRILSSAK